MMVHGTIMDIKSMRPAQEQKEVVLRCKKNKLSDCPMSLSIK